MPTKSVPFASSFHAGNPNRINMVNNAVYGNLVNYGCARPGILDPIEGLFARLVTTGIDPSIEPRPTTHLGDAGIVPYEITPMVQIHDVFSIVENYPIAPHYPIVYLCCPPIEFPAVTGYILYYLIYNQTRNATLIHNMLKVSVNDHKVILRGSLPGDPLRLIGISFGSERRLA